MFLDDKILVEWLTSVVLEPGRLYAHGPKLSPPYLPLFIVFHITSSPPSS